MDQSTSPFAHEAATIADFHGSTGTFPCLNSFLAQSIEMVFGDPQRSQVLENARANLEKLLAEGQEFTFQNFAILKDGFPKAHTPAWVAWTTRVTSIISKMFGEGSAVFHILESARNVATLGNYDDKFEQAKSHYIAALENGLTVLENDTFGELISRENAIAPHDLSNKVFIVHGHDSIAKNDLEAILREMGLDPIVLHRQVDAGKTIIEKFEEHADVGFAFVLLTADEIAFLTRDKELPDAERTMEYRARPNVIFEFGYFVGKIGRSRTCCIYRGNVSLPSDLDGLLYKKYTSSVEEVAYAIQKELKAAGYNLA